MPDITNELTEMFEEEKARVISAAANSQWSPLISSIEDEYLRGMTAVMLENEDAWVGSLNEDMRTNSIAGYEKFVFPIIRAVYPNLVATQLVSVQPMSAPTSLVFYLDAVYGSNKGSIKAGDTMLSALRGHTSDSDFYSSEHITGEVHSAAGSTTETFTLDYGSARPGTVVITVGSDSVADNGAGGLLTSGDITGGTIDYSTGAVSMSFTSGPSASDPITVNYDYNSEASDNIPAVDFTITQTPVVARAHKLRARWSVEAQINLRNVHGLDAENELVSLMSEKIRWDIDRTIIADLQRIADNASSPYSWDKTPPDASIPYNDHKMTFFDALIEMSNEIFKKTRRGYGNFVVCGPDVANVIESLYGFRPAAVSGSGVVFMGTLRNRWMIFKDPYMGNKMLVGYKANNLFETGYIYAPYVPLMMTPTIMLDDFVGRKGLYSSYAKKAVNGLFYMVGEVIAS